MDHRKTRYNLGYKIAAVKLVANSYYSVVAIASDLGIHYNTLYKWIKLYSGNLQDTGTVAEVTATEVTATEMGMIQHLSSENERLTQELKHLKSQIADIQSLTAKIAI